MPFRKGRICARGEVVAIQVPENIEKRQIGELWEKRSNGKCFSIMPKGEDFEAIQQKAQTALQSLKITDEKKVLMPLINVTPDEDVLKEPKYY